jgi:hypothetical protein
VRVPNRAELDAISARVQNAGLAIQERGDEILVRDPSQNQIALAVRNQVA